MNSGAKIIIGHYDAGLISRQDLYLLLLQEADDADDLDLFVSEVPQEHLNGLSECVTEYMRDESPVLVGSVRVESPRSQTIARLHAALNRMLNAPNAP